MRCSEPGHFKHSDNYSLSCCTGKRIGGSFRKSRVQRNRCNIYSHSGEWRFIPGISVEGQRDQCRNRNRFIYLYTCKCRCGVMRFDIVGNLHHRKSGHLQLDHDGGEPDFTCECGHISLRQPGMPGHNGNIYCQSYQRWLLTCISVESQRHRCRE